MEGAVQGRALFSPGEPALLGGSGVPEDTPADCRPGLSDHGRGTGRRTDRTPGAPGAGCTPAPDLRVDARRTGHLAPDGGAPVQGLCRLQPGAGQRGLRTCGREPFCPSESGTSTHPGTARAAAACGAVCVACVGLSVSWGGVCVAWGENGERVWWPQDEQLSSGDRRCYHCYCWFSSSLCKRSRSLYGQSC